MGLRQKKYRKKLIHRCINPPCGRQFRHASPLAKTCSSACKQAVYRARRKEAAELEAARQEFERTVKYQRILLEVRRREAERQAAERQAAQEAEDDQPPEPTPPPRRKRKRPHFEFCTCGCRREPEPSKVVTINVGSWKRLVDKHVTRF